MPETDNAGREYGTPLAPGLEVGPETEAGDCPACASSALYHDPHMLKYECPDCRTLFDPSDIDDQGGDD